MQLVGTLISVLLNIYFVILIARMILSWVPVLVPGWEPKGPFLVVAELIYSLTDPPLRFLRRILPSVQVGTVAFDLGFLVLMIGISLLLMLNSMVFLS